MVSSDWRLGLQNLKKLKSTFSELNLNYQNDYLKTNSLLNPVRGRQIDEFLGKHNVGNNFVIIDDNMDEVARFFPKYHIIQPTNRGLKDKDINDFFNNKFPAILNENNLQK